MMELTALSSRSGRTIATFLNCYLSHSTARFWRVGEKCYVYFADDYCCFQQWKNFNSRWSCCKEL